MVGLRRYFIALLLCFLGLSAVAQERSDGFIERQLRQLTLRGERVDLTLTAARKEFATSPSDSLSVIIHELEKQLSSINGAIEKLSEQQKAAIEQQEQEQEQEQEQIDTLIPTTEQAEEVVVTEAPEEAVEQVSEHSVGKSEEAVEEVHEQEVAEDAQEVVTPTIEKEVIPTEVVEQPTTTEEPSEDTINKEQNAKQERVISDELKSLFNATARRYALIEQEIDSLINDYNRVYGELFEALGGYEDATSLPSLEKHYADYLGAVERSAKIETSIADRSDLLLTSKSNSYLMFADTLGLDSLRAAYITSAEQTETTMTEKLAGRCTDLDLAMFPHRLRGTMLLEAELARYYAPESADSLLGRYEKYDTTYTLFTPWSTPKRSNVEFKGVKINKKAKEKAVSSLPTIKAPAEGELYSIMVGNYSNLPPSTKAFRGATPLYREHREDGRTYIYIGLYPTANSAQEDIALLRKTGFKQPILVMWRDGIRRDDFVDKSATSTPKAAMWRIEISGIATTIPSEILAVIKNKAPRKEISKFSDTEGATIYTIGVFTKESEAKALATALGKASSTISVKITQVGKK